MAGVDDASVATDESSQFHSHPASRTPRRPLLGVSILFLLGTAGGLCMPVPAWVPFAGSSLSLIGMWRTSRQSIASLFLFVSLCLAGWSAASFAIDPPGRTHLPRLLQRPAEAVALTGIIVDDPSLEARASAGSEAQWAFLLAVETIDRMGTPIRAHGRVQCRWNNGDAQPAYGQRWSFQGVLRDHARLQTDSLRRHRMSMTIGGPGPSLLESDRGNPLIAACYLARHAASRILATGLGDQPETVGLLKALMLGYRSELSPELQQTFEVTGTLHIFAISGLHVGVFASLVMVLLRTLGLPRHRWSLILAPVLLAYVIGTGMKPSALRACIMALAFWSGPTFWRKPDAPSALALAALLIVGARPQELFSPGFILSFSVVAGILALFPLFNQVIQGCLGPDPMQRDAEAAGNRRWRGLAVWAWALFALSLACWLVSFPLTARMFSLFSPVGLLGNLAVVPGAFLVVLTGCLSLVFGLFSPLLAEIFNHANAIFIGGLLAVVKGLSAIPFGHWYVERPGMGLMLGWYMILVGWRMLDPRYRIYWAPVLPVAIAAWIVSWSLHATRPWLTVLPADGSTMAQVIADREVLLVGVPNAWYADQIVENMHSQGINHVQALVLTSTTDDALEGAEYLLGNLSISEVWLPHSLSPAWSQRLWAYEAELRLLRQGERGYLADGSEWEVLALPAPAWGGPVLRFARNQDAVLYMAAPDRSTQFALSRAALEPAATLLVVSDSSRPPALLPVWIRDTGASSIVAARKRRLSREDDYARWQRELRALSLDVRLLRDGERWVLPTSPAPRSGSVGRSPN